MRAHEEAVAAARRARARPRMTRCDTAPRLRGCVSASAYDKAKAAAEAARELNAAEARADVARNETSYAVLLADADGVVVETLAEPGHVVGAGQVVVRVAHAGRREAVIELPETLRPAIGSTGRATLYGSGLTGPANFASCRTPRTVRLGRSRLGTCWRAVWQTRRSARPSPSRSRTAGPRRRCRYRSARSSIRARVPAYGWSKGKRLASRRAVHIAGLSGEAASVVGNLKAGDRVVALGAHLLHEGEHVRRLPQGEAGSVAGNERGSDERLQSLRARRTRARRHPVPARGDLHRRRRWPS